MNDDLPRGLHWFIACVFVGLGLIFGFGELVAGRYLFCRRGGFGCMGELEVDAWFVVAAFIHAALFLVPGLAMARHLMRTRKR